MNFLKNPLPFDVHRADDKSGDYLPRLLLYCAELSLRVIKSLRKMTNLLVLIPVVGCSFHSAQWESAKALWAMRAPVAQPENETYWWDMKHGGETYRLFPVAWGGKTVLTDSRRWMIVLQNSEITMIRDFQENKQITFEDSVDAIVGADETGGDADSSRSHLDSSYPGVGTEVLIVESPMGKPMNSTKTKTSCLPSRFDFQSSRSITRCFLGEQEIDLRMEELNGPGNISTLWLNLHLSKSWVIHRSGDLVDALEVKRYLDGDVDEI